MSVSVASRGSTGGAVRRQGLENLRGHMPRVGAEGQQTQENFGNQIRQGALPGPRGGTWGWRYDKAGSTVPGSLNASKSFGQRHGSLPSLPQGCESWHTEVRGKYASQVPWPSGTFEPFHPTPLAESAQFAQAQDWPNWHDLRRKNASQNVHLRIVSDPGGRPPSSMPHRPTTTSTQASALDRPVSSLSVPDLSLKARPPTVTHHDFRTILEASERAATGGRVITPASTVSARSGIGVSNPNMAGNQVLRSLKPWSQAF